MALFFAKLMSACSINDVPCALLAFGTALPILALANPAFALQPVDDFVTAAKTRNFDACESRATADQRREEARRAGAQLGPTFGARASYTRNEFQIVVQLPGAPGAAAPTPVTMTPLDQLDASFSVTLPLVDVGAVERLRSAKAASEAAGARVSATDVDVEKSVVRAYYQVVAAEGTMVAAERALTTAIESRAIVATRREAGSASDLDTARSSAQVERARQVVASADQARRVTRRSLQSLSGLAPSEGTVPLPEDALVEEPSLEALEPAVADLPSVHAALLDSRAAARTAEASWAALLPSISASATERLTNATGFSGRVGSWSAGVTANWTLDPSAVFAARAQGSARTASEVRARRVEQQAKDELHAAFQEVRAGISKVRAAKAESLASARAAALARDRYQVGSATSLEVQQAERDAFDSEVARIQAQSDLAYARIAVRLDSGRPRPSGKETVR